jgi:excisionase family DNA binding protein
MDPANVDWMESRDDRPTPDTRLGFMEEFLFQNIRRIVREEVRSALGDLMQQPSTAPRDGGADYLSVEEAAKVARLHHTTIREWIKDGSLTAFRAGRVYRIRRSDLDERLTAKIAEPVSVQVEERVTAILAKRASRAA